MGEGARIMHGRGERVIPDTLFSKRKECKRKKRAMDLSRTVLSHLFDHNCYQEIESGKKKIKSIQERPQTSPTQKANLGLICHQVVAR